MTPFCPLRCQAIPWIFFNAFFLLASTNFAFILSLLSLAGWAEVISRSSPVTGSISNSPSSIFSGFTSGSVSQEGWGLSVGATFVFDLGAVSFCCPGATCFFFFLVGVFAGLTSGFWAGIIGFSAVFVVSPSISPSAWRSKPMSINADPFKILVVVPSIPLEPWPPGLWVPSVKYLTYPDTPSLATVSLLLASTNPPSTVRASSDTWYFLAATMFFNNCAKLSAT